MPHHSERPGAVEKDNWISGAPCCVFLLVPTCTENDILLTTLLGLYALDASEVFVSVMPPPAFFFVASGGTIFFGFESTPGYAANASWGAFS